jgi:hypothetical protein
MKVILQVLQSRDFAEKNTVVYRLRGKESSRQVIRIARFTSMWSQHKGIKPAITSPLIQLCHVGVHVVEVIGVGWVKRDIPIFREWVFLISSNEREEESRVGWGSKLQ